MGEGPLEDGSCGGGVLRSRADARGAEDGLAHGAGARVDRLGHHPVAGRVQREQHGLQVQALAERARREPRVECLARRAERIEHLDRRSSAGVRRERDHDAGGVLGADERAAAQHRGPGIRLRREDDVGQRQRRDETDALHSAGPNRASPNEDGVLCARCASKAPTKQIALAA